MIRRLILFLIFLSAPCAYAGWYQVEAVVFDRLSTDASDELWIKDPGLPNQRNSIELITDVSQSDNPVPYQVLPKNKYRMHGAYQALKLSKTYRPLIHISWQQPSGGETRPVRVVKLRDDGPESGGEAALSVPEAIIDGFVRVRSAQLLHVNIDLAYYPRHSPALPTTDDNDRRFKREIEYVRLHETRKIKLNELHYFDHPMFGVILQVRRLNPGE